MLSALLFWPHADAIEEVGFVYLFFWGGGNDPVL